MGYFAKSTMKLKILSLQAKKLFYKWEILKSLITKQVIVKICLINLTEKNLTLNFLSVKKIYKEFLLNLWKRIAMKCRNLVQQMEKVILLQLAQWAKDSNLNNLINKNSSVQQFKRKVKRKWSKFLWKNKSVFICAIY